MTRRDRSTRGSGSARASGAGPTSTMASVSRWAYRNACRLEPRLGGFDLDVLDVPYRGLATTPPDDENRRRRCERDPDRERVGELERIGERRCRMGCQRV